MTSIAALYRRLHRFSIALAVTLIGFATSAEAVPPHRAGQHGFHGAIAIHVPTGSVGYSFNLRNARDARNVALNQCSHPECVVVASARNSCAAVATEAGRVWSAQGTTRNEAETKLRNKCVSTGTCNVAAWTCTS